MNFLEKIVYHAVKKNPRLKFFIRNLYQSFFDLMPVSTSKLPSNSLLIENAFHGFHDVSPVRGNRLIYIEAPSELKMPTTHDAANIILYNIKQKSVIYKLSTNTFNFHKGARQQWISDTEFAYNDYETDYCSYLFDAESFKKRKLPYPIDSYCEVNRVFSSFSYERLEYGMPGYGYPHRVSSEFETHLEKEGMFTFDKYGNVTSRLTINEVLESGKSTISESGFHFFTHSSFSKCGKFLAFLHRKVGTDVRVRETQIVFFDLDTNCFDIAPTTGMVSHYDWIDGRNILMYASVNGVDGHYVYSLNSLQFSDFFPNILDSDGHQSVSSSGRYVLVDTYPNRRRLQRLYLFDAASNTYQILASVYHPKEFQSPDHEHHWGCDLHPRFHDGGYSFDLIFDSKRSICVAPLHLD